MEYGYRLKTRTRNQSIHLDGLQKGHVALQLFACWYDSKLKTSPSQQCFTMIDCFYRMLEENPELVRDRARGLRLPRPVRYSAASNPPAKSSLKIPPAFGGMFSKPAK